jgi:hypothetical protein
MLLCWLLLDHTSKYTSKITKKAKKNLCINFYKNKRIKKSNNKSIKTE